MIYSINNIFINLFNRNFKDFFFKKNKYIFNRKFWMNEVEQYAERDV
jgi:hypothetical protein